jgi:branched-chain amino acid transport system ATP-binding protein
MLELADVHTYYGNIRALRGLSLSVQRGEIVTLIGANGAGKTTTLRTILGTVRPRRGTVSFNGQTISTLATDRIVRLGIAQSPEGRRIFPRMSVLENLELGAFARADHEGIASDLERVFTLFPRLRERITQKGGTLSGGEQQMLAIGRALMARPALLLLDEPSMGLSPILVETIFRIVQDINGQGTTILLVEQNARMALRVAHRGYVIQTGRIVLKISPPSCCAQTSCERPTWARNRLDSTPIHPRSSGGIDDSMDRPHHCGRHKRHRRGGLRHGCVVGWRTEYGKAPRHRGNGCHRGRKPCHTFRGAEKRAGRRARAGRTPSRPQRLAASTAAPCGRGISGSRATLRSSVGVHRRPAYTTSKRSQTTGIRGSGVRPMR